MVEAKVLAGLVEPDGVGPALVVGVAELDPVVFPETDLADVVGVGRRLFEGKKSAAGQAKRRPSGVS